MIEVARFLTPALAEEIQRQFGTPTYVYSERLLKEAAEQVLAFGAPFGFTPRYAMKASPNRTILQLFYSMGMEIDASSGYEASRAMAAGIPAAAIMLTAQELPRNLKELVEAGVFYNACSLHQIESYGQLFPGTELAVRINPGAGSGFHSKVVVAGEEAGFAIWKDAIPEVLALLKKYDLKVRTVHTHIGSGTDPDEWQRIAEPCVALLDQFPEATHLSLGGGFKVAYMKGDKTANMKAISERVSGLLRVFAERTGRQIHLEIEPGRFLVAQAGALLTRVQDETHTSKNHFLKLDTGMTEILRPTMYGAQHPIVVLNDSTETEEYLVVGHCCESGDLLSPDPDNAAKEKPRLMAKAAIGDLVSIEVAGAYCSGMSAKHYNSFPEAPEVLIREDGTLQLIRRRQSLEQLMENEV